MPDSEIYIYPEIWFYSQLLCSVLKTGLEALSSRQLPVLIKTGWKMSCCGQFLSRCLHKYKAVLIIKTTWWFWASFSSLPWRWLHNCLEALSSRQSTTTQKMPVFKPGLDFTTYMQTTWKLLSWRPTTTTGCNSFVLPLSPASVWPLWAVRPVRGWILAHVSDQQFSLRPTGFQPSPERPRVP